MIGAGSGPGSDVRPVVAGVVHDVAGRVVELVVAVDLAALTPLTALLAQVQDELILRPAPGRGLGDPAPLAGADERLGTGMPRGQCFGDDLLAVSITIAPVGCSAASAPRRIAASAVGRRSGPDP